MTTRYHRITTKPTGLCAMLLQLAGPVHDFRENVSEDDEEQDSDVDVVEGGLKRTVLAAPRLNVNYY